MGGAIFALKWFMQKYPISCMAWTIRVIRVIRGVLKGIANT